MPYKSYSGKWNKENTLRRPSKTIEEFEKTLNKHKIEVTVRREMGSDWCCLWSVKEKILKRRKLREWDVWLV